MLSLIRPSRISFNCHRIYYFTNFTRTFQRTAYAMAPLPSNTKPIVISGPSGVGKGTLYKLLLHRHPDLFCTSISHTTRDPRPGETRDKDYYYVPMADFEKLIGEGGFVENAMFGGNRYGTSKKMIEEMAKKGRIVVLDIEMEGVKQIQTSKFPARFIFISPPEPALETLESRLRGRGTEKEESIQKRLAQARLELEYSKTPGVHDIIIVNDDLEKAYKEVEEFIFREEKTTQEQGAKDGDEAGLSVNN